MFAWATKEYLLWNMTIGQIVLYYNKAIKIKNGVQEKAPGLVEKSASELRKLKEQIIKDEEDRLKKEKSDNQKEIMRAKYGAID